MPIRFPVPPGTILRCNFHTFKEPEMTKSRPVVVLSPLIQNHSRTTLIVVALSTTDPAPRLSYHLRVAFPGAALPKDLKNECWLKGDMVYSLCLSRFDFYHFGRDKRTGKRAYYKDRFTGESLVKIRKAVMFAIGHL